MNFNRVLRGVLTTIASLMPAVGGTIFLTNDQNNLLRVDSATPGVIQSNMSISGLAAGDSIVGIDFRPATGVLYGLGSSSRLYTIDTTTGSATAVGGAGAFALAGDAFGFDFNPVPDRIRVTSDSAQNLRLNPNNGALAATDGTLAYASGDANFGVQPMVVAAGYTNSKAGATTTTLYGIDFALGVLVIQNPPNAGVLNTVGSLGISTTNQVGFDILPGAGTAFASLTSGSSSSLYTINLVTGAASLVGAIGDGSHTITGLAAVTDVPEPATIGLVGAAMVALAALRRRKTTV